MNEMPFKAAKKTSSGTAVAPPCVLVIFGASGDLTKRLLMPAIYNLVNEGLLDEDFAILGVNRGDDKEDAFRKARRMSPEEAIKNSVRGQYVFGEVKDKAMQAYRQSPDVDTKSKTETYIALKLFIDNWRWADVPFYIRTGKAMTARKTEVAIQFKKAPGVLFRDVDGGELSNSRLVFRIQPDEGVQMRFSVKQPGRKVKLSDVNMNFRYSDYFKSAPSTGYETLIYDCLIGDATLFQRADNVESGWAVVQPLRDAWAAGQDMVHWPVLYGNGSNQFERYQQIANQTGANFTIVSFHRDCKCPNNEEQRQPNPNKNRVPYPMVPPLPMPRLPMPLPELVPVPL